MKEAKKKNSSWFKKERTPWNKDLTKETDPRVANSKETIEKMRESKRGTKLSKETIEKIRKSKMGESNSAKRPEVRIKISESRRGDKHWNWQGGVWNDPYPEEFVLVRKEVKIRDGYRCQLCGKMEIDEKKVLDKGLAVHHIDYNKQNCDIENLLTLCCSCHGKVNFNRGYWEILLKDMLRKRVLI